MRERLILCLLFAAPLIMTGQSLSGHWLGTLEQPEAGRKFQYRISLEQDGRSVNGVSFVHTEGNTDSASFVLAGMLDTQVLLLQELEQRWPESPAWCLKYATLQREWINGREVLRGTWEAEGCLPGTIFLQKIEKEEQKAPLAVTPFSILGNWTDDKQQLELRPGGEGAYEVFSRKGKKEQLKIYWRYDQKTKLLYLHEVQTTVKANDGRRYCMKSSVLRIQKRGPEYILKGGIHHFSTTDCEPEPVVLRQLQQNIAARPDTSPDLAPYTFSEGRKIKTSKVLEVKNENLVLKVWDNGTVDGDVVTLFLNGKKIIDNYRVRKHKASVRIQLKARHNFLILHAEDLGELIPNTVAVSIDDGTREQRVVVSSDLRESGAIMIRQIRQH